MAEEEVEEEEEAEEKGGPEILFLSFLQLLVDVWVLPNEYDSSGFFCDTTSCAMLRSTVDTAPVRVRQCTVALGRISHSFPRPLAVTCSVPGLPEEHVCWIGTWLQENASYSARLIRRWIQFMRQSRRLLPARAVRTWKLDTISSVPSYPALTCSVCVA